MAFVGKKERWLRFRIAARCLVSASYHRRSSNCDDVRVTGCLPRAASVLPRAASVLPCASSVLPLASSDRPINKRARR